MTLGLAILGQSAWAHRIDEYLQATVLSVSADRVHASMRLVPGVQVAPTIIGDIDRNGDGVLSDDERHAYAERVVAELTLASNGHAVRPKLLSWSFSSPAEMRAGLGEIHIEYLAELPAGDLDRRLVVENHHRTSMSVYLINALIPEDPAIQVLAQTRNEQQSRYELSYRQATAPAGVLPALSSRTRAWASGVQFASLFQLGMRHIAGGTDHLLFLLTLLLPAPLLVAGARWGAPRTVRRSLRQVVKIVTAFTVGHSITLALAALSFIHVPSGPIEVLIAVSIFVSALHAWRPIAAGKEIWIAGFFGLIHGLAFAATLEQLGLERWQRVGGILAFNLGIEAMQLLIVAAILPSLILLSATRVYPLFRITGASIAGAASLGWIVERLFNLETPLDSLADSLGRHVFYLAGGFFVLSLTYRFRAAPDRSDSRWPWCIRRLLRATAPHS